MRSQGIYPCSCLEDINFICITLPFPHLTAKCALVVADSHMWLSCRINGGSLSLVLLLATGLLFHDVFVQAVDDCDRQEDSCS